MAYHNSYRGSFLFDDQRFIDNPRIHHLWPPDLLFYSTRPLTNLTFALNYTFAGRRVLDYHVVNLALHLLAGLALYGLLRRTLRSPLLAFRYDPQAQWLAFVVAALWVIHPLQTSSVDYLIQRAEVLMGLFYLLTLYCVVRSQQDTHPTRWEAAAIGMGTLGVLSKPIIVTVPIVAFLFDRVFFYPSLGEAVRRRWRLYAGLAASWILLAILVTRPNESTTTSGFSLRTVSPLQYLATQPLVILYYLKLSLWPHPLCLDYQWPMVKEVSTALPAVLVIVVLIGMTIWAWRRSPALGFLGAWFFLILAPTSSFIPLEDPAFEHRMYLPLAAIISLIVAGMWNGIRRLTTQPQHQARTAFGVAAIVAFLFTGMTIQRNKEYQDPVTIWRQVIAQRPDGVRGYTNLAAALIDAGRYDEARRVLREALRLDPDEAEAHYNIGVILIRQKHFEEAISYLRESIRLNPNDPETHYNLGIALAELGKFDGAIKEFEQAIQLRPDYTEALNNLGTVLIWRGRYQEAIPYLERAQRFAPQLEDARFNLDLARRQLKKLRPQ